MYAFIVFAIKFNPVDSLLATEVDSTGVVSCTVVDNASDCSGVLNIDSCNESLCIVSQNIRSINKNLDRFLLFVAHLDLQVDIFVLSECWTNNNFAPPAICNYKMYQSNRSYNQNDGVVVYVREDLEVLVDEPVTLADCNCLQIQIGENLTIIAIYRPPCFTSPTVFLESLETQLEGIKSPNIILTGDINIDVLDVQSETSSDYLELMAYYGLLQGITHPTRLPSNTCLDHFMVRCRNIWQTVIFGNAQITDHCPILFYANNFKLHKKAQFQNNKMKLNYDGIKQHWMALNWHDFYSSDNVNYLLEFLVKGLQSGISANSTITKIPRRKRPLKPWITVGIVKSLRKRDKLHSMLKTNKDDTLKTKYIKYRNWCNKIVKYLKKHYYETQLLNSYGNIKETWKVIKEVCNLNSKKSISTELLSLSNSPKTSLDLINNYFTTVGSNLANSTLDKLRTTDRVLASKVKCAQSPSCSMFLHLTTPEEVDIIVSELRTNCAPGFDGITSELMKKLRQVITEPLSHLCNVSFETGTFPSVLKEAIVTPIYKAGDRKLPTNYRPISVLTTISKIIEKLVNKRLICYLESNSILSKNQFGFRRNKSTEDAVLSLTSLVSGYVDAGERCVGVFLDLQKAFDTVCIPILLAKLESIGIRGVVHDWFREYLTDRTQSVRVAHDMSDKAFCTYGVPQGSTLGPTLFLVYIDDLCKMKIAGADLTMFADDTAIIFRGTTWDDVREVAERGLCEVTGWLENNLLSLNTDKTKYLCFSMTKASSPLDSFSINIHTYPCNRSTVVAGMPCSCPYLNRSNHIKYLGVIIDDKLKWDQHLTLQANRVRKLIYVFKSLRQVADIKLRLQTYKSLCECIINYCICVWGGAASTHLSRLERAQRAVLKVLLYLPKRHPTALVYKQAGVLSVRRLFVYSTTRRYHRHDVPFLPNSNKRSYKCPVPRVRSAYAQRFYSYIAPLLYNSLNAQLFFRSFSCRQMKKLLFDHLMAMDSDVVEQYLKPLQ